jgi:hypothetical protein
MVSATQMPADMTTATFFGFWHTAHHVLAAVHKVKSHMNRAQATELDQIEWSQGNTLADLQANLALPRHQEIELTDFLMLQPLRKWRP